MGGGVRGRSRNRRRASLGQDRGRSGVPGPGPCGRAGRYRGSGERTRLRYGRRRPRREPRPRGSRARHHRQQGAPGLDRRAAPGLDHAGLLDAPCHGQGPHGLLSQGPRDPPRRDPRASGQPGRHGRGERLGQGPRADRARRGRRDPASLADPRDPDRPARRLLAQAPPAAHRRHRHDAPREREQSDARGRHPSCGPHRGQRRVGDPRPRPDRRTAAAQHRQSARRRGPADERGRHPREPAGIRAAGGGHHARGR